MLRVERIVIHVSRRLWLGDTGIQAFEMCKRNVERNLYREMQADRVSNGDVKQQYYLFSLFNE